MNILLIFPGFIVAFIIVFYYKRKIRRTERNRNKVHFYVTCEVNHRGEIFHTLWIGKPTYKEGEVLQGFVPNKWSNILDVGPFRSYELNYSDFEDMKNGEVREVFLNIED